jgi:hypothetical protein
MVREKPGHIADVDNANILAETIIYLYELWRCCHVPGVNVTHNNMEIEN